ncbi:MAG: agmatine deiminase family protein [Planctomycetota bacterium]
MSPRLPAEWEPQERVLVARPANADTWPTPEALDAARQEFDALVDAIGVVTPVTDIAELGIPVDDAWLRDTTPLFTDDGAGALHAHCFRFTAYGGKFPHDLDRRVAERVADALSLPRTTHGLALEGGAIETNGQGLAITTRACTLDDARNPGLTHDDLAGTLRDTLGIETLVMLDASLPGDFTDGHIDNLLRFTAADRAICVPPLLEQARRHLTPLGIEVIEMPLPDPPTYTYPDRMLEAGTQPLAASYANFLITNGRVVMPTFGQPSDAEAARLLGVAFSDHRIVALPSSTLLVGGGSFHCLTAQMPTGLPIRSG